MSENKLPEVECLPEPQAARFADNPHRYIVASRPSSVDINRAAAERKVVLSFHRLPEGLESVRDQRMWLDGFCRGCGFEPSPYVQVLFVPPGLDIESVIHSYLERAKKQRRPERPPFSVPPRGLKVIDPREGDLT